LADNPTIYDCFDYISVEWMTTYTNSEWIECGITNGDINVYYPDIYTQQYITYNNKYLYYDESTLTLYLDKERDVAPYDDESSYKFEFKEISPYYQIICSAGASNLTLGGDDASFYISSSDLTDEDGNTKFYIYKTGTGYIYFQDIVNESTEENFDNNTSTNIVEVSYTSYESNASAFVFKNVESNPRPVSDAFECPEGYIVFKWGTNGTCKGANGDSTKDVYCNETWDKSQYEPNCNDDTECEWVIDSSEPTISSVTGEEQDWETDDYYNVWTTLLDKQEPEYIRAYKDTPRNICRGTDVLKTDAAERKTSGETEGTSYRSLAENRCADFDGYWPSGIDYNNSPFICDVTNYDTTYEKACEDCELTSETQTRTTCGGNGNFCATGGEQGTGDFYCRESSVKCKTTQRYCSVCETGYTCISGTTYCSCDDDKIPCTYVP
jgi:hypothetical protein